MRNSAAGIIDAPSKDSNRRPAPLRGENFIAMLFASPDAAMENVLESEELNRARMQVMDIAARKLIKVLRTATELSRKRRRYAEEDCAERMAILNNKTAPLHGHIVQVSSPPKTTLQKVGRFKSLAKNIRSKIKMDHVFETQASRQRKRPSVIVKAAEEGDISFLKDLLSFRQDTVSGQTKSEGEPPGPGIGHMQARILSSLRRQFSSIWGSDPTKAQEEAHNLVEEIRNEVLDFEDSSGKSALHAALAQGQWACAKCLLAEPDVHVNTRNFVTRTLPLHVFLSQDGILPHLNFLDHLLPAEETDNGQRSNPGKSEAEQGDLVNALTTENVSPLMIAAGNHHLGTARDVQDLTFSYIEDKERSSLAAESKSKEGNAKSRRKAAAEAAAAAMRKNMEEKAKEAERQVKEYNKFIESATNSSKLVVGGEVKPGPLEVVQENDEENCPPDLVKEPSNFVIELLVQRRANPVLQDVHGCTALDYAARAGVVSHVEYLCSLQEFTQVHKESALFFAVVGHHARAGDLNVLSFLINHAGVKGHGSYFSGQDLHRNKAVNTIPGETILHVAARMKRDTCLQKLLVWLPIEAIYMKDAHDDTALHHALKHDIDGISADSRNACAQILIERILENRGLSYAPAAAVTMTEIAAEVQARNEVPTTDPMSTRISPPFASPSSPGRISHWSGQASPSSREQSRPSSPEDPFWSFLEPLGSQVEGEGILPHSIWAKIPVSGRSSPEMKMEAIYRAKGATSKYRPYKQVLPLAELREELLLSDEQQETLADVLTPSTLSAACSGPNSDMILQLLTLMPQLKDVSFRDQDQITNILSWAVRRRSLEIVGRLLQLGVNVNAAEPGPCGLTPLMLCVQGLSKSKWSTLGMKCLELGKDEPYIKLSELTTAMQMKTPEIISLAENLRDNAGNPLKSPTGRLLFKRSPWCFSWHGLTSLCMSMDPEIGNQIATCAEEMEDFHKILQALLDCADTDLNILVNEHTAASLAASSGNWKLVEDLTQCGARADAALIEALAVHNCCDQLDISLKHEFVQPEENRELSVERMMKIFHRTCAAGHAQSAEMILQHMNALGVGKDGAELRLIEAVRCRQHWMIDFHVKSMGHALDEEKMGQALLMSAQHSDYRTVDRLLNCRANPNFRYTSVEGHLTTPLLIAGAKWASSGSEDDHDVLVCLLRSGCDVRQVDRFGNSVMIWAASRGNDKLLRLALATAKKNLERHEVIDVLNMQDATGRTALMHAVLSRNDDCVLKMLHEGADPDILSYAIQDPTSSNVDDAHRYPLTALAMVTSACSTVVPGFMIALLEHTKRLDVRDVWGDKFFDWACRWGHAQAVERALQMNDAASIGAHDYVPGQRSPLELAIIGKYKDVVLAILRTWNRQGQYKDAERAGAYVGLRGILNEAIANEWQDVLLLFIEVMPDRAFRQDHAVVLHALYVCVERRWLDGLQALLARRVCPSHHQPDGNIPILTACKLNDAEMVRILLDAGAKDLELCIAVVVLNGNQSCFDLLWKGADHSADLVRVAACLAALTDNREILSMVLAAEKPEHLLHQYGRKVRDIVQGWCPKRGLLATVLPQLNALLKRDDPSAPLLCAVSKGHYGVTVLLLEHRADVLIQNDMGLSPLAWACAIGNLDIVQVLLKSGADIPLEPEGEELSLEGVRRAYLSMEMADLLGFLRRHNPLYTEPISPPPVRIILSPLLVALIKGNADVVRLLLEAGASRERLPHWCAAARESDPGAKSLIDRMLTMATELEDLKAFGPFGLGLSPINISDARFVPLEGRLAAILVRYSDTDWSLQGLQFVHEVRGTHRFCKRHHTSYPNAGDWETTIEQMHLERMDMLPNEYVMQAEVGIGSQHIVSLRFTTNRRVTKWLGGCEGGGGGQVQMPKDVVRVVNVAPAGREIVGVFSSTHDKLLQIGFITRLRMGDNSWRRSIPTTPTSQPADRLQEL